MVLKNHSYFNEEEKINGKKELTLIIDCFRCSEANKSIFDNINCQSCLLYNLYINKNRKIDYIYLLWNDIIIKPNQFNLIIEYFQELKKIKKHYKKIKYIRNQKCKYKEFKCSFFSNSSFIQGLHHLIYYNPIELYSNIIEKLFNNKKVNPINSICQKCRAILNSSLEKILKILNSLKIIQKFQEFQQYKQTLKNNINFYEFFLTNSQTLKKRTKEFEGLNNITDLLKTYYFGKYSSFQASIFKIPYENEKIYLVKNFLEKNENEDYIEKLIQDVKTNINEIEFNDIVSIENLIRIYREEAIKILNSRYNLSKIIEDRISFIVAIKKLNFEKLFPLLIDDYIEEIFIDSPNDELYINHQEFGRCRTSIKFTKKDIERVKTLLRLYSGKRLDLQNPTLKFVIKNKFFYCRFAIDVEPLQIYNFALDIRKLNKNIFTIQDLLKNGTLDSTLASFLYFNLLRRKNITVTGETDTGKTTLINALDLITPKEFRKIYIENVIESLNQSDFGKHQLKYKVDSLENNNKFSKSNQIKTLLHRTPDIIYLGEILTKEECEAMFHCLAAGLRGFQTIHANDIGSLINRFLFHFNIDKSCLDDLDLIILMKKDIKKRRIISISEINNTQIENSDLNNPIFLFNPDLEKWEIHKSLFHTNVINKLKKYENLSEELFSQFLNIYEDIFKFLLNNEKLQNLELVNLFHKISYFSFKSIKSIKVFWNNWKKERSLNF